MKIILSHRPGECHILDLRAAVAALEKYGNPGDGIGNLIEFENGEIYYVRWNKASVSVWKQEEQQ